MTGNGDDGTGRDDDALGRDLNDALPTDPVAMMVRETLRAPAIDPQFRQQLRDRLLAEANQQPPVVSMTSRWNRRVTRAALPAAAALVAAVALIVAIVAPWRTPTPSVPVSAVSAVSGSVSVNPASSVLVHFSQPMDHRSVEAAFQIEPAVAVRTAWQGEDLVVSPENELAPNTGYLIGFDPSRARTANGARPTANPRIGFGTAPIAPRQLPLAPMTLQLATVAPAADGSEAVIAPDGSVLATALRFGTGPPALALTQPDGSRPQVVAAATQAICVSRSGRSVAYLLSSAAGTSIVMANGDGLSGRQLAAPVDAGSPLGWIGDEEVSFVSGGALKAIDRVGTIRTLVAGPVHAETDTVTIAPGGRWIFLAPAPAAGAPAGSAIDGRLIDVQTGSTRILASVVGSPAFSADGATVYWVDGNSSTRQLAVASSGGGPVLRIPLPVVAGDGMTDLGVNGDGSLLLYTVHHADGSTQLRLASLPSGSTLAVADAVGQSPNWSPKGDGIAVLAAGTKGPQIDVVRIPNSLRSTQAAVEETANAFARAQIAGDPGAMRSISPTVSLDLAGHLHPTRSSLLVTTRQSATTWQVGLRLVRDPTPASPVQLVALETLTIDTLSGRPVVTAVTSPPFSPVPRGPHLTAVTAGDGLVVLTFDSDLDPATLSRGIILTRPDGKRISVSLRYDPIAKVVVAQGVPSGTTRIEITNGLRDIKGRGAAHSRSEVVTGTA
jgi:hypothetical protein